MKIDAFSHFLPKKYIEAVSKKVNSNAVDIWSGTPPLSEVDIRLRVMDMYPDVRQILTVATLPFNINTENIFTPKENADLSRIANDEMAEVVAKYPNKFVSAAACLPLNDIDAAIKEADRTITQLHFKGIQIFSNISGAPLDAPEFRPLYKRMAEHDLPIWIHPWGNPIPASGDLLSNPIMGLGWPFETTVAMGCLANSGVFEECPNIKFIMHHCGGMIPFFAKRIAMAGWKREMLGEPRKRVVDNFHKFFVDTAVYGNSAALMCGYDYFGVDHLLFGTDTPLGGSADSSGSYRCTEDTIRSIEQMSITSQDKEKIFEYNAKQLLHLSG